MRDQTTQQPNISFTSRLRAYLELMRPANIITAFADILAGFSAAGGVILFEGTAPSVAPAGIGWLLLSTFGLYGGGVVFNDVFDAKLDARERPERAIPSRRASMSGAVIMGILLFTLGIFAAFQVNMYSGILAVFITACALIYDARTKQSSFWGPLFMGFCRGGNLLLGCSIIPLALSQVWFIALLPILYIGSITLVSQGEVHGGSQTAGTGALGLILFVIFSLIILGYLPSYTITTTLPFVLLFGIMVVPPFAKAAFNPTPVLIKKAVKRGVLSLILLNGALAAGFGGWIPGVLVLLLLPLSIGLSKLFAVT